MLSIFHERVNDVIKVLLYNGEQHEEHGDSDVMGYINCNVHTNDIVSLKDSLNDQIINCYSVMLSKENDQVNLNSKQLDSFVLSDCLIGKKKISWFPKKVDVFNYDILFGCLNISQAHHWVAIILDLRSNDLIYMDPLNSKFCQTKRMKNVITNFNTFSKGKGLGEWTLKVPKDHPCQIDDISCGIFCLVFLERFLKGADTTVPFDVDEERRKIAGKIISALRQKPNESCYRCMKAPFNLRKCRMCQRTFHRDCMRSVTCSVCNLLEAEKSKGIQKKADRKQAKVDDKDTDKSKKLQKPSTCKKRKQAKVDDNDTEIQLPLKKRKHDKQDAKPKEKATHTSSSSSSSKTQDDGPEKKDEEVTESSSSSSLKTQDDGPGKKDKKVAESSSSSKTQDDGPGKKDEEVAESSSSSSSKTQDDGPGNKDEEIAESSSSSSSKTQDDGPGKIDEEIAESSSSSSSKTQDDGPGKKDEEIAEKIQLTDWSKINSRQDLLLSNLRTVPSRLVPKTTNKAGTGRSYTISGKEFAARVEGPENITSGVVLGQYLCLGKGKDSTNMANNYSELGRIVKLLNAKKQKPIYSAFSLLPEEELKSVCKSLKNIATDTIEEDEIRSNINKQMKFRSKAAQTVAVENTRTMVTAALTELEKTEFDTATHGGMKLLRSVWGIIDSVLPR